MFTLNCCSNLLTIDSPIVMGIINATPDSFYKGNIKDDILGLAAQMLSNGATILDIGGQSTKPNSLKIDTVEEYLYGYPGDEYIDILGLDNYGDLRQDATNMARFVNMLEIIVSLANEKYKPAALTETGSFTLFGNATMPEKNWFTKKLIKGIMRNELTRQISYIMVWRNANSGHFHTPYPDHPAIPDFIDFYNHPYTLFMSDMGKTQD